MKIVLTHNVSFRKADKDFVKKLKSIYGFSGKLHGLGLKNVTDNLLKLLNFEKGEGIKSSVFIRVGSGYLEETAEELKHFLKNGWDFYMLFEPFRDIEGSFRLQRDILEWKIGSIYGVRLYGGIPSEKHINLFAREALAFDSSFMAETLMSYDPTWIREDLVELPIGFSFSDMLIKLRLDLKTVLEYLRAKIESAMEINVKAFLIEFPQEIFTGKGEQLLTYIIDLAKEKKLEFSTCSEVVKEFRKSRIKPSQL